MKVDSIVKAMEKQEYQFEGKTEPAKLVRSALNRRDDLFVRGKRGYYGLKTWTDKKEESEQGDTG